MTFDEATAKVGTYLKNNDLSNSDNNDRFFHIILNGLRQEYAPTVNMTKEDRNTFRFYLENSTFFSLIGRNHAVIEAEMLGITEGVNEFLDLSDEDLMQAWLHPETIKIVDE